MVRKDKIKAFLLLTCLALPMAACSKEEKQGATDIKTEGVEYVDAFKDLKDPKGDVDAKEDDSKSVDENKEDSKDAKNIGEVRRYHNDELGFSISIPVEKYGVTGYDITTEEENDVKTFNIMIKRGEIGGNLASIVVAKAGVEVPGSDNMEALGAKDGYKYYFKKLREHDKEVKSDNLKELIKDMQSLVYDIEESFKLD